MTPSNPICSMKTLLLIAFLASFSVLFLVTCDKIDRNNPWDDNNTLDPLEWAPQNLDMEVLSFTQKQFTWDYGEHNIEGFKVDRKEGDGDWKVAYATLDKEARSWLDTEIVPDTSLIYSYRVYAFAGNNSSAYAYTPFPVYGNGVTDINGNAYVTIIIGEQEWMAENLRVTRYNNSDDIPTGLSNAEWENTASGAYAIYPHGSIDGLNSDAEVVAAYGKLYNWYAVDDSRGLCPEGWSVPSDADWTALVDCVVSQGFPNELNNPNGAANALKSCRQLYSPLGGDCTTSTHPHWNYYGTYHGFDEFGFSALPGGVRFPNGSFYYLGTFGSWWSSTEYSSSRAWSRLMISGYGYVSRDGNSKRDGFSVRCLRDLD